MSCYMENMKNTDYYKSGNHTKNASNAREKALEASRIKKIERVEAYNANPNKCAFCDSALPYDQKRKKFCNSSCAAKYNNSGRSLSEETKQKISESVKEFKQTEEWKIRQVDIIKTRKLPNRKKILKNSSIHNNERFYEIVCSVCNKHILMKSSQRYRKTCSDECKTTASINNRTYQNGKKKLFKYFNKWINKEVNLESSWELEIAQLLDNHDIKWIRPKAMKWIDEKQKNRLYYCDFFLPDFNVYLDPKNPYCMTLDQYKIIWFKQHINLIVGDIQIIKDFISNIVKP